MHANRSVEVKDFAMVPRNDVPRATFGVETAHKTTFDAGLLIPIFIDEVLPGDQFNLSATMFARLATPITAVMDNLRLRTWAFFVPNRLLWTNWEKSQGEQINPGDSTAFLIPTATSPTGGYAPLSLQDYCGLPTVGQLTGGLSFTHNNLPLRGYNIIYNEWFRDENLQNSITGALAADLGDGPDNPANYVLQQRNKGPGYFTNALPWPQKGNPVMLPLGTSAPIKSDGTAFQMRGGAGGQVTFNTTGAVGATLTANATTNAGSVNWGPVGQATTGLYADLSGATAATLNSLRLASATQQVLERDARGGTRYIEILYSHFGVRSPDARLQRPEYLGGGVTNVNLNPIAQTSGTGATGQSTPQGNLAAMGTALADGHGFSQAFVEHGYIIMLACVSADLTYQQGVRKMWTRSTRFDFYLPALANIGEQAVLNKEIYATGNPTLDDAVFGYQERWAEYRYQPSIITGLYKSTTAGTLDIWHYAEKFATPPALNSAFIKDPSKAVVTRTTAVSAQANGTQFLVDSFFRVKKVRPMPKFSVPGLMRF